jgi:hypothetical protein
MQGLEGPHAELHRLIRDIIDLREGGKSAEAERQYLKIEPLSREIVQMLGTIEQKLAAA